MKRINVNEKLYFWYDSDKNKILSAKFHELKPFVNKKDGREYLKIRFNGSAKTISLKKANELSHEGDENEKL